MATPVVGRRLFPEKKVAKHQHLRELWPRLARNKHQQKRISASFVGTLKSELSEQTDGCEHKAEPTPTVADFTWDKWEIRSAPNLHDGTDRRENRTATTHLWALQCSTAPQWRPTVDRRAQDRRPWKSLTPERNRAKLGGGRMAESWAAQPTLTTLEV